MRKAALDQVFEASYTELLSAALRHAGRERAADAVHNFYCETIGSYRGPVPTTTEELCTLFASYLRTLGFERRMAGEYATDRQAYNNYLYGLHPREDTLPIAHAARQYLSQISAYKRGIILKRKRGLSYASIARYFKKTPSAVRLMHGRVMRDFKMWYMDRRKGR